MDSYLDYRRKKDIEKPIEQEEETHKKKGVQELFDLKGVDSKLKAKIISLDKQELKKEKEKKKNEKSNDRYPVVRQ